MKIARPNKATIGARVEAALPKENAPKPEIKVTDKRIFTPEGEIREEYRGNVTPVVPDLAPTPTPAPAPAPAAEPEPPPAHAPASASDSNRAAEPPPASGPSQEPQPGRRRAERGANPGTPFTNFAESLVMQAYMSLGMLRNPYAPAAAEIDVQGARQIIDIVALLGEKTKGNLTPEEDDFLKAHLGELKLAFVQRTKTI